MTRKIVTLLALAACAFTSGAFTSSAMAGDRCFYSDRVADWSASKDHQTVYLRVNGSDYYRVDLPTPIKQLSSHSRHLLVGSRNGLICQASDLDLDLAVAPNMTLPLRAAKLTRLSAEEITEIGPENLPGRYYRRH